MSGASVVLLALISSDGLLLVYNDKCIENIHNLILSLLFKRMTSLYKD